MQNHQPAPQNPCRFLIVRHLPILLLCLSYMAALPVMAVQSIDLQLGSLDGGGWKVEGLVLHLNPQTQTATARLSIKTLHLDVLRQSLHDLRLDCGVLELPAGGLRCLQGRLYGDAPLFGANGAAAELDLAGDNLRLFIHPQTEQYGGLRVTWQSAAKGSRLQLEAQNLDLEKLLELIAYSLEIPEGSALSGRLDGSFDLAMSPNGIQSILFDGKTRQLTYADATGNQAGENLDLDLSIKAMPAYQAKEISAWNLQSRLQLKAGAVYSSPLYFEHKGKAAQFNCQLDWQVSSRRLALRDCVYDHPAIIRLSAGGDLILKPEAPIAFENFKAELRPSPVNDIYRVYLKNFLADKGYGDLELQGRFGALFQSHGGQSSVSLNLQDIDLRKPAGDETNDSGSEIQGLSGILHWQSGIENAKNSRLAWNKILLSPGIPLGAGQLDLRLYADNAELLKPLTQPVLDGSLVVEEFRLRHATDKNKRELHATAGLRPISMKSLSKALHWQSEPAGQISGMIPAVEYADQNLKIGGALLLKVFDGNIVIHNLGVEGLFKEEPTLSADVKMDNLNLERLTDFFAFGRISGLLSGYIKQLRMVNWSPESFDAAFYTPKDDKSKHRISQKALNNLSSLGGSGVTKVLSRSVLRVFKHFSYQSIGWRCKLENNICDMRGVEKAPNGYYIVKGDLLPRIDVIGYNQRVNWDELLNRLRSVSGLGGRDVVVE